MPLVAVILAGVASGVIGWLIHGVVTTPLDTPADHAPGPDSDPIGDATGMIGAQQMSAIATGTTIRRTHWTQALSQDADTDPTEAAWWAQQRPQQQVISDAAAAEAVGAPAIASGPVIE